VRRMIGRLARGTPGEQFHRQWLQLRSLESRVHGRPADVPGFRRTTSARRSVARRRCSSPTSCAATAARSICSNADYTFLNERLAKHYGDQRRVWLAVPSREGDRSESPRTARGREVCCRSHRCATPHVACAAGQIDSVDVPQHAATSHRRRLCRRSRRATNLRPGPRTVRQQMEMHRSSPTCASCHRLIDPPGFALENFNPVGSGARRTPLGRRSTRPACWPTGQRSIGPGRVA
jgi:hypothetical protein